MMIVLNHKMKLTYQEAKEYAELLDKTTYTDQVVVCPNMAYLSLFRGSNYKLGSQDVSPFLTGSHTGDVSSEQLKSLKVKYCLIGHSERRSDYQEDNKIILKKAQALLSQEIRPILCIGETFSEKSDKKNILINEIKNVFDALNKEEQQQIIIAYEPIWAIGTGQVPDKQEIEETISFIKQLIKENYEINCEVLYGGSINEQNYSDLKQIAVLDGLLIGGFSIRINDLQKLLEVQ